MVQPCVGVRGLLYTQPTRDRREKPLYGGKASHRGMDESGRSREKGRPKTKRLLNPRAFFISKESRGSLSFWILGVFISNGGQARPP